ncbi:hypothetical protein HDU85_003905 [Gaertneriomyces sp. JEL0708]|nr:hypothetical protein HDU85_003905 [Gaertneriomyces sp. JEL0708]
MEEITTIFVVGFPDDMHEREFQNMFTFSNGFEAATLKIPSQTDSDDGIGLGAGRKQIIGFAKFRSRLDALEARDLLSGRKVDAEKGCILKAEMAKKNLHTKRGLSSEQFLANYNMHQLAINRRGSKDSGIYEPYYTNGTPLPTPPMSREYYSTSDLNDAYDMYVPQEPLLARSNHSEYSGHVSLSAEFDKSRTILPDVSAFSDSSFETIPTPPSSVARRPSYQQNDRGFNSALFCSESLLPRLTIPAPTTNLAASISSASSVSSTGSAPNSAATSPTHASGPFGPRSIDQNPPCNTLYVGNLPPDASEDELRQLFCRTQGYKRLCFRVRSNGPMCFVEFEDVQCATKALFQLYGNTLSNSTKGGIRLSYSKNPLGVRSSQPGVIPAPSHPSYLADGGVLIHGQ